MVKCSARNRYGCIFKVFTLNKNLRRHHRLYHDGPSSSFKYIPCNRYFSDRSNYQQHILQHSKFGDGVETFNIINCTDCNRQIPKTNWYYHIWTNAHKLSYADKNRNDHSWVESNGEEVKCVRSVFNNRIIIYFIANKNETYLIPEHFLSGIKYNEVKLLSNMI